MKLYVIIIIHSLLLFSLISCNETIRNKKVSQANESNIDDGKLTRDKAKKLIIAKESLPKTIYIYDKTFDKYTNALNNGNIIFFLDGNINKNIVDNNGNSLFQEYDPLHWYPIPAYCILTDEGKQYLSPDGLLKNQPPKNEWHYILYGDYQNYSVPNLDNKVGLRVGTIEFSEVTGIQENGNSASVEYTLLLNNITPFGNDVSLYDGMLVSKRAFFSKYDDGWRLN